MRHNLLDDAGTATQRPYAVAGERGLVLCTWPTGGRPDVPTLYCDEVWTGVEYQVAAHCVREGLLEEGPPSRRPSGIDTTVADGTRSTRSNAATTTCGPCPVGACSKRRSASAGIRSTGR
ncbi:hypothetical protein G7085_09220 [Tessaracoccus sp. HDW20]|nr:hypothetical protein [Tessaracoccus coleopterorum]